MQAGVGVVLVPTVVPGVSQNLGEIIQLAVENIPVRGVHFVDKLYRAILSVLSGGV